MFVMDVGYVMYVCIYACMYLKNDMYDMYVCVCVLWLYVCMVCMVCM